MCKLRQRIKWQQAIIKIDSAEFISSSTRLCECISVCVYVQFAALRFAAGKTAGTVQRIRIRIFIVVVLVVRMIHVCVCVSRCLV